MALLKRLLFWTLLSGGVTGWQEPGSAQDAEPSPGWAFIQVPGAWETDGPAEARNYDGFAWYRTWLKPHDSFFSKHERDLFAESVTLSLRDLADAHEVFVNGTRIGGGGRFPPHYESGRAGNHRHKVPPGLLEKGAWNEIAIRVYNPNGPGGFLSEAPFIMDYFMECVLEGIWEFRLGDGGGWTGPALSTRPASSSFDRFQESNRILGEAEEFVHGEKLPPEESHRLMRPHAAFAVDAMVAEPLVAQPVHFSFDERGRLWVSQYRQYPYPAGLKMVSRDKYYRSHYDKVPPAPPNHDRGRDLISIHEDTNGDGAFDRHTVFQDGLNMANAAVRGRGGVWVMHTPYLLFYPDANFDDAPDGPPVAHLAGFGLEDTHSTANGLVWGMDGWLYGAQGSTTTSRVVRPGLDGPEEPGVYFEGCMVWRYHPETRAYEIFAEGSGNTFGLEIDGEGRLFSGHNGANTRGWHYVQGGIYLKQGVDPGKFGPPRHPYAFGDLPMIEAEETIQRFSHLFAVGEGTALPEGFMGKLFSVDPLHNVVIASERRASGATFETRDAGPVLSSEDGSFRPVYIANAPDGSLFVADFYEHYIAHGQHYQSQIDATTGRIYRLRGKNSRLEKDVDLSRKSAADLVSLLEHPNKWHRQTAVRLLGEMKEEGVAADLKILLARGTGPSAWSALWALHQMNALDERTLVEGLGHPDAPVRKWAVRFAGDIWGRNPGLGLGPGAGSMSIRDLPAAVGAALLEQAGNEGDAEVRSQIASTARRLDVARGLPLVSALLRNEEDQNDPFVPLLCWWALEHHFSRDRGRVLELFKETALWEQPTVFEHILPRLMRRAAAEGRRQDLLICAELLRMAPSPAHAARLLEGFEEAYRGRPMTGFPEELISALAAGGKTSLMLRLRQGHSTAVEETLELLKNSRGSVEERLPLTRALGELRINESIPALLALVESDPAKEIRKAALASLAVFDEERIPARINSMLSSLPEELRAAAYLMLSSRPKWALDLLESMEAGRIGISTVPAEIADRLRGHPEEAIRAKAARLFPRSEWDGAADFSERLAAVEEALRGGSGNPYTGEKIYADRCASCHKLFHKGGNAGPDLTQYQRNHLGTLLVSIIQPNAEIREGYEAYEIETEDGRTLTGFLTDRDGKVLMLRMLDGQDLSLAESEIREIQPTGRSLMPEGLLDGLSEQQLRDFFAYLRSSQPFTR